MSRETIELFFRELRIEWKECVGRAILVALVVLGFAAWFWLAYQMVNNDPLERAAQRVIEEHTKKEAPPAAKR